jgi:thiol-disulfide isomerase/thioredoxin
MVTILLLGAFLLAPPPPAASSLTVGSVVPKDAAFTDINGAVHTLGEFRGRIVLLHFWSVACPFERAAEPKLIEIQQAYRDKGVVEIGVDANQDELAVGGVTYANLRDHVAKAGVNFLVAVDPGNVLTDLLGGLSATHSFVIDRDGVLRYAGALDDDPRGDKGPQARAYVRAAIDALLAGTPVRVPTTRPYG